MHHDPNLCSDPETELLVFLNSLVTFSILLFQQAEDKQKEVFGFLRESNAESTINH